jgi:hypothetical protein
MLPSGSSIFHPHLQGAVNPTPTTVQRLLSEVPAGRFRDYLDHERAEGVRYLGGLDRVEWLTSFAPVGPCELRAFVPGVPSPTMLDEETVEELGAGIAVAAGLYAELGYGSFNLALYGAPPDLDGYPLNLRMICRSSLALLSLRRHVAGAPPLGGRGRHEPGGARAGGGRSLRRSARREDRRLRGVVGATDAGAARRPDRDRARLRRAAAGPRRLIRRRVRLLLDTHGLLWWLADDARLGRRARQVIRSAG